MLRGVVGSWKRCQAPIKIAETGFLMNERANEALSSRCAGNIRKHFISVFIHSALKKKPKVECIIISYRMQRRELEAGNYSQSSHDCRETSTCESSMLSRHLLGDTAMTESLSFQERPALGMPDDERSMTSSAHIVCHSMERVNGENWRTSMCLFVECEGTLSHCFCSL